MDETTASGFIALQVHGIGANGKEGQNVRFKNIRIMTEDLLANSWNTPDKVIPQVNCMDNKLTEREESEGWKLLFDGKTSTGWRGAKMATFPTKGWVIEDGVLKILKSDGRESANAGDIVTVDKYSEFELEVDFLITEGKNIAPVEVKSSNYCSHSSLDKFRKRFSSVIGNSYILYTKDVMIKDGIIHLPLYMSELL